MGLRSALVLELDSQLPIDPHTGKVAAQVRRVLVKVTALDGMMALDDDVMRVSSKPLEIGA